MHRNTFINSPTCLNADFSLKNNPRKRTVYVIVAALAVPVAVKAFAEIYAVTCNNGRGSIVKMQLKEMRTLGSLMTDAADKTQIPAGGALAVEREIGTLALGFNLFAAIAGCKIRSLRAALGTFEEVAVLALFKHHKR